ncbi:UNVERIFIED_CONTAM: hypothetical protein Sradi_5628200 [Sesamum radiatum]|uniref:Retrovirus-related Pol polyprotein from transposon TNT 1-94-like beta-barrel domain-containing protein n=1 Tax=Sesamum radiatum TaxID=300843 RepID=A0AAW2L0G5_SESRA
MSASQQLIQFLVGLNNMYDQARSQILLLEPLPAVMKAFSMLIRMEKQLQVNVSSMELQSGAAYQIRTQGMKKKPFIDKKSLFCEHCQKTGHCKETCFKIHGVPDWYKDLADQRKKVWVVGPFAAVTTAVNEKTSLQIDGANIADIIRTEVRRAMNDEMPMDPLKVNFVHLEEYAGTSMNSVSMISSSWIVDSGATNHICANLQLFSSFTSPKRPITIHLPNGDTQSVSHIGSVKLSQDITLSQVLHIPKFSVNLISVKQLCSDSFFQFRFLNSECILQDPKSEKVVAIGKVVGNLYVLEFPESKNQHYLLLMFLAVQYLVMLLFVIMRFGINDSDMCPTPL